MPRYSRLVGLAVLEDTMKCVKDHGIVCITGMAGGKWVFENFYPNAIIPTSVCLATYSGGPLNFMGTPLDQIAQKVVDGTLKVPIKTSTLDQIMQAHQAMDDDTAGAKIVVLL